MKKLLSITFLALLIIGCTSEQANKVVQISNTKIDIPQPKEEIVQTKEELQLSVERNLLDFQKKTEQGDMDGAFKIYKSLNTDEKNFWHEKMMISKDHIFLNTESILDAFVKSILEQQSINMQKSENKAEELRREREIEIEKMYEEAMK